MKSTRIAAAVALAALASVSFQAQAAGAEPAKKPAARAVKPAEVPEVLRELQKSANLEIIKGFKAEGGLAGWIVKDANQAESTIVYTTPDGQVLLAGLAINKAGKNLTAEYTALHVPKQDYTQTLKTFSAGGEAAGVTFGSPNAKAEIIALFDANCGFCKLLHRLVEPAVDAGELRVRYIPVAILGADSAPKGAGLLAAKDPKKLASAMAAGVPAETSNDPALLAKVRANNELMKKSGFNGTPAVIYVTGKGTSEEVVNVSNGLPAMGTLFTRLGISGQVDKLKANPELARYLN